jgi:hypothetical protein
VAKFEEFLGVVGGLRTQTATTTSVNKTENLHRPIAEDISHDNICISRGNVELSR